MANAGVKVTISAADRASATLEKINTRIARLQAPVRRVQAAFGRFASLSGLNRLKNGFVGLGREALGAFRYIGQIVPVMGMLTSAASLAGMARLVSAWGQLGTNLRATAGSMGMAPQRLQAMQNAAKLSGSSAEAMTGALKTLSTTRWNALNNMDPQAAAQFSAIGLDLRKFQNEAPDKFFNRVAHAIRGLRDPVARTVAATTLLGSSAEQMQSIWQETDEQWQKDLETGRKHAYMTKDMADRADQYRRSQESLNESVHHFADSVADAASPALVDLNNFLEDLIDRNRDWIAQDIGRYVQQFSYWFRNGGWDQIKAGIKGVEDTVTGVVDKLGGWKSAGRIALGAIAAIYAMPVISGLLMLAATILSVAGAFTKMGTAAKEASLASRFAPGAPGGTRGRGSFRASPTDILSGIGVAYDMYEAYQHGNLIPGEGEGVLDKIPGYSRFNRWWNRMSGADVAPLEQPVQDAALAAARQFGLDPKHYIALLRKEHGGYRNVSGAGAFGPSQLMPATARGLGLPDSVNDPNYDWRQNLTGGAYYYRTLLDRFHGNYEAADAAYNAGPNSRRVNEFAQTHDLSVLPNETQDYVAGIAKLAQMPSGPAASMPSGSESDGGTTTHEIKVGMDMQLPPGAKARIIDAPPGTTLTQRTQVQRAMDPALSSTGN